MKKLISVLLSFSLIFNVIGYGQTCEVSAAEVNQENQQCLKQDLCKDPKNISLMAALITVVTSILELLCYLCVGTLCYTWSVLRRFPSSVCELFAGTLSTENEELKRNLSDVKGLLETENEELKRNLSDVKKLLESEKRVKERFEENVIKCISDKKCRVEYERVQGNKN